MRSSGVGLILDEATLGDELGSGVQVERHAAVVIAVSVGDDHMRDLAGMSFEQEVALGSGLLTHAGVDDHVTIGRLDEKDVAETEGERDGLGDGRELRTQAGQLRDS